METKNREQIVNDAIVKASRCGKGNTPEDAIVYLTEQVDFFKTRAKELSKRLQERDGENEGQAKLIIDLKDRAERAENEIRELKAEEGLARLANTIYKVAENMQTLVTVNRAPEDILSVSVIFAGGEEE